MGYFDTALMLLKLLIAFGLFYFIIPLQTIRFETDEKSGLDKFFISLIHSNLFIIVIVYLFAVMKIYETISLAIICLLVLGYFMKKRVKTESITMSMKTLVLIFDYSENRERSKQKFYDLINKSRKQWKTVWKNLSLWYRQHYISLSVLIITLLIGVWVRIYHAFIHLYFAASDPYVHLTWSKKLGQNIIYEDGIYPYGFEAMISGLNKLSQIDPYYIARFMGPITGALIMLSIVYVLGKQVKNELIFIIVAMVMYISDMGFTENAWRQMSALSMEYAIVFFLPGIYFLIKYFETADKRKLLLAAECLMIVALTHLYISLCLIGAFTLITILNVVRIFRFRDVTRYILMMFAACFFGFLPLFIGTLLGLRFYSAKNGFVSKNFGLLDFSHFLEKASQFHEGSPGLVLFLICLVVWLILVMFRVGKIYDLGYIAVAVMLYAMYRAEELGLPYLVPAYRIGVMLLIVAVIVIIMPSYLILSVIKSKREQAFNITKSILGTLTIVIIIYSWPITIPEEREAFQYDDTVQAYLDIKKNIPYLNWTIISPQEDSQLTYTYGSHTHLWELVQSISGKESKKLQILTDYIFIFVEKIPLGANHKINEEDAKKPFPSPDSQSDLTKYYYGTVENRTILEAKAYYWAENYMKTHKDIEIYMDTENIRVYKIKQDKLKPITFQ
jgi:hypothetical protein